MFCFKLRLEPAFRRGLGLGISLKYSAQEKVNKTRLRRAT